jgi:hypothetical protein
LSKRFKASIIIGRARINIRDVQGTLISFIANDTGDSSVPLYTTALPSISIAM